MATMSVNPTLNVVRVTNDGDTDFNDMYASQPYSIPAGQDNFIPFDAVCLWLGDPRTRDLGPRDKHRTKEFHRVMQRTGAYDHDKGWFDDHRPQLTVHTTAGVMVPMVASDPYGDGANPFPAGEDATENLQSRVNRLEGLLGKLGSMETPDIDAALADMKSSEPTANVAVGGVRSPTPTPTNGPPEDKPVKPKAS